VDLIAVRPIAERSSVSIRSLMSPDPLVMTVNDTAAAAALAMWSRGLKSLPVVTSAGGRLIGCIRAETVMKAVLQRVASPPGFPEPARVRAGVYVEGGVTVSE
jgi:predicted transcriptional regulator